MAGMEPNPPTSWVTKETANPIADIKANLSQTGMMVSGPGPFPFLDRLTRVYGAANVTALAPDTEHPFDAAARLETELEAFHEAHVRQRGFAPTVQTLYEHLLRNRQAPLTPPPAARA